MKNNIKYIYLIIIMLLIMPTNVLALEKINFCVETSAIWQFLGYILVAVKIVIPLIIIVLGIVDLAKAVASSDDKAINKSFSSVLKRLIAGVVIFFIPTIVSFIFLLIKDAGEFMEEADACQKCLLNPNSSECSGYKKTASQARNNN